MEVSGSLTPPIAFVWMEDEDPHLLNFSVNCTTANTLYGKLHECIRHGIRYTIRYRFPSIVNPQEGFLPLNVVFLGCFVICLMGNASVLTMIWGVLRDGRPHATPRGEHTIIYICALCITDMTSSVVLPMIISDNLVGFWVLGVTLCKLYHLCGSVGRFVSAMLIVAITFDRYVAVCYPFISVFRTKKFVYCVITGVVITALFLMSPALINANANEEIIYEYPEGTNITRVFVYKCDDRLPRPVFLWFTYSNFTVGYLIPLTMIFYFDYRMIRELHVHSRSRHNSIPLTRIVRYTVLLSVVYFCAWTPYWFSVLYGTYFDNQHKTPDIPVLFLMHVLYILPYIAIATNWIFYGLLNTQLQHRMDLRTGLLSGSSTERCVPIYGEDTCKSRESLVMARMSRSRT